MYADYRVRDLVKRLEWVLAAMTADPSRRLSSIDLLDGTELARLDGWANRAVLIRPALAAVSIPEVFAARVARHPEAVALVCGEQSWTYRQLDEAANRLAHLLIGHGAGRGSGWRCCFPARLRRLWRFWGAEDGAAYVPIDPRIRGRACGCCLRMLRRWRR
ncbi:AMP-binding enzyme family protein [Mycobacterium xenopi 4042]|uniref:AMP-binding enzyme family protein n=1 Tax=Mycobacterium xenopi 4042 TaxID=1299334 RepID=X8AP01_MYCXE|nr:AMP-binding enzyme family protein [Mycobacterium xenopi 4042]